MQDTLLALSCLPVWHRTLYHELPCSLATVALIGVLFHNPPQTVPTLLSGTSKTFDLQIRLHASLRLSRLSNMPPDRSLGCVTRADEPGTNERGSWYPLLWSMNHGHIWVNLTNPD